MANLNERICTYCNCVFVPVYVDKDGYSHTRTDVDHCSKSCATKHTRSIPKEDLVKKAVDFINNEQKYCTKEEICNSTGHSSKTFGKHGISFTRLNEIAGFTKPKSKFQENVMEILIDKFPLIETEKTFNGLVGITGYPLRVDFYIPEINTVVEADGAQHADPKHQWGNFKNGTIKQYDEIKNEFFRKNGIRLIRIPYKRALKKSDISSLFI